MATELDITAGLVDLTSTLVDRINALDERLSRIERELSVQAEALNRLRFPEKATRRNGMDYGTGGPGEPYGT